MPITARILLDSLSPTRVRLTTWELTYPRFIHSELMTHRVYSRNAASSRAIPVNKMLERIENDPAVPIWWGANEPGMQAWAEVDDKEGAREWWLESCRLALGQAQKGHARGLHKQIVNRVVEPYMHITVILSGTMFKNLFFLRTHKDAEPHFQALAKLMKPAFDASTPRELKAGEWHMPLTDYAEDRQPAERLIADEMGCYYWDTSPTRIRELVDETLRKVSVGRCARVSYLTHDGKRDLAEDVKLHDKLMSGIRTADPLHMSPFEHIAQARGDGDARPSCGNFTRGWDQYRKMITGETGPREDDA